LGLRRRDERLVLQIVRERDGLDELLQANQAVAIPPDSLDVVLDGGQEVLDFLDSLLVLLGDVCRDGLVQFSNSAGRRMLV
jgi:hypothetical protein